LYWLDRPANRDAVLAWLKDANATVKFENARFGYLDAELDWKDLPTLIAEATRTGLDPKTLLKVAAQIQAARSSVRFIRRVMARKYLSFATRSPPRWGAPARTSPGKESKSPSLTETSTCRAPTFTKTASSIT
jgi:hypothetical protein